MSDLSVFQCPACGRAVETRARAVRCRHCAHPSAIPTAMPMRLTGPADEERGASGSSAHAYHTPPASAAAWENAVRVVENNS